MQYPIGALVLIVLVLASITGCTTSNPEPVALPETTIPVTLPTPDGTLAAVPSSDMALQPADLPADYILRERSVMTSPEVSQMTRDLGWKQGYYVTFDRTGRSRNDQTRVRQAVSIFPVENMNKVFKLEKIDLSQGTNPFASQNEIPFPVVGDQSVAFRMTDTPEVGQVTYTIIFTKKNVFERITMSGTSTDYEMFRDIANRAAAKII